MAHFRPIPNAALEQINWKLGKILPRTNLAKIMGLEHVEAQAELRESADIFMLGAEDIPSAKSIASVAYPTGRWHHQISSLGMPVGYAVSIESESPDNWNVSEVSGAKRFSSNFDKAISIIDQRYPDKDDNILVSMLKIPAFHIDALWMRGNGISEVAILNSPDMAVNPQEILGKDESIIVMPETDFLETLRHKKVIEGFTDLSV